MCYLFADEDPISHMSAIGITSSSNNNNGGKLNFIQFVAAIVELKGEVDDRMIGKAFDMIAGRAGEKFITRQQLFDTIRNSAHNASQAKQFLKEMKKVIVEHQQTRTPNSFMSFDGSPSKHLPTTPGEKDDLIISFDTFKRIMQQ